jgi:uncharacterized membrane protein (UPF0127 family)
MKYRVSCYNGAPLLGIDLVFVKPDEAVVEVDAENEPQAIGEARKKVTRDYYKIIGVN